MNISDKQSYTFWEFLERPVTIPRLQRNYVQGTIVNGKIRAKNLVKAVLDAVLSKDGKIALDLVYGSRPHDEAFHPIDGQQRLTLLWILHWYIWKRACIEKDGDIENTEEIRQKLNNFTYATRASSRDFLKALVDEKTFPLIKDAPLKKEIVESRFFFTDWVFDPTISSILNVIQEMDDRFQDEKEVCFEKIWNRLSSQQDVITFRICDTVKLKQTEELYIKMNGRGKLLESIENLKADFIKELGESNVKFEDKHFIYFWNQLNEIQKNKYYENKNLEDGVGPDGAIYRLICRFFLDRYAQGWSKLDGVKGFSYRDFSNQKSWKELMYLESSGEYYTIDSFKIWDIFNQKILKSNNEDELSISKEVNEKVNGCRPALELESLVSDFFKFMDKLCEIHAQGVSICSINLEATPYWNDVAQRENDPYKSLIPEANLPAGKFDEKHCAVFHAVMLYINKFPTVNEKTWKDNYKAWLHFVWNIIANCSSNILELIKLLDKIADVIFADNKDINVYSQLKDYDPEIDEDNNMYRQLVEEIIKAKYRGSELSELIYEIEKKFHGYTRVFFLESGLRDLNIKEEINAGTIRGRWTRWEEWINMEKEKEMIRSLNLLQHIGGDEELSDNHIFRPANKDKEKYWIDYFKDSKASRFNFLCKVLDDKSELTKKEQEGKCIEKEKEKKTRYRKILSSDESLVKHLIDKGEGEGYVFRFDIHGMKIKNSRSRKDILLSSYAETRGKILHILQQSNKDFSIDEAHRVGESVFLKGRIINFNYKNNDYQWDSNGKISIKDHKQIEKICDCENIGSLLEKLAELEDDKYIQIDSDNFDIESYNN